jgi:hypothetical protein
MKINIAPSLKTKNIQNFLDLPKNIIHEAKNIHIPATTFSALLLLLSNYFSMLRKPIHSLIVSFHLII